MTPQAISALLELNISPKRTIKRSSELTERQQKAIDFYTSFGYGLMNSALRSEDIFTTEFIRVQPAIEACSTALSLLPNYIDSHTYRRMTPFEGAESIYAQGNDVKELGYTSASKHDISYFGTWKLTFDGQLGKYIAPFSHLPKEEEVLFDKNFNHVIISNETDQEEDTISIESKERILNNFNLTTYAV